MKFRLLSAIAFIFCSMLIYGQEVLETVDAQSSGDTENPAAVQVKKNEEHRYQLVPPQAIPYWLAKSSLASAPPLIQGMLNYFHHVHPHFVIPSYHRLILVGPPGVGKSTLARAIANDIGYGYYLKDASSFAGRFRNETADRIRSFFHDLFHEAERNQKIVVVIDEMNKLVENYSDFHSDDSMTAGALWLMLDQIEERYPNLIIIATMNSASCLPQEIISRFSGRIVTLEKPNRETIVSAFLNYLDNDQSIIWNHLFYDLDWICDKLVTFSMRDMKSLVESAKIYSIAHMNITEDKKIMLTQESFEQAFAQLERESRVTTKSFIEKQYQSMKRWHLVTGLALNLYGIYRISSSGYASIKATVYNVFDAIAH